MTVPRINDRTLIRELRNRDTPSPHNAEMNGWPLDVFYIKCISTTLLLLNTRHFVDLKG